jgi:RimJ/RimL family protein N-acetyltransferase
MWRADDLDQVAGGCADPEVPRWTLMPSPYTRADAEDFLEHQAGEWLTGRGAPLCICRADDESVVLGGTGVFPNPEPGVGRIGYWIARPYRRQGYVTRAIALLVDWARTEAHLDRIVADVIVGNDASMRVLEGAGFTCIGPVEGGIVQRGETREAILFEYASPAP